MVMETSDPTALGPHPTFKIKDANKNSPEREKVHTEIILKLLDPNEVNMVGCHRRGRDNFPTVAVVVNHKVNKSWKGTRQRIIAVLDSYQLSMVAVEIVKGTIERAAKSQIELRRSHIQRPDEFDSSLGLEGLVHASSIFGGFVQLKRPDTMLPLWKKRTGPSMVQCESVVTFSFS